MKTAGARASFRPEPAPNVVISWCWADHRSAGRLIARQTMERSLELISQIGQKFPARPHSSAGSEVRSSTEDAAVPWFSAKAGRPNYKR